MKKLLEPHFYCIDLNNYTDDFLREIILWQKQRIEELEKLNNEMIRRFGSKT